MFDISTLLGYLGLLVVIVRALTQIGPVHYHFSFLFILDISLDYCMIPIQHVQKTVYLASHLYFRAHFFSV